MAGKSLPLPNGIDRELWEGTSQGELRLQRCKSCGQVQFFPRPSCTNCFGGDIEWIKSSGKGKVHTYTLVRVPRNPAFKDEVPIYLAEIELEEGVRILSRIVGEKRDTVALGAPVRVVFQETENPEIKLPVFELAE